MKINEIEVLIANSTVGEVLCLNLITKEEVARMRNTLQSAKKFGYDFVLKKMYDSKYSYIKLVEGKRDEWMKRRKRYDLRK